MKTGKASWTASMTATFRAIESLRPADERLFVDQYAAAFLRLSVRLVLKNVFLAKFILWLGVDRRFPGATDTIVSRIRFIDDCLKHCIQGGVEQVVILGAGYDSRAYRFNELKEKIVFEVDHPDTQKLKKEKVLKIFNKLPDYVTYVPVDFEKELLMSKLLNTGYNQNLKTLFIWEGVSKYLTSNAVYELLSEVAGNSCEGSSIVFDYLFKAMIEGRMNSRVGDKILKFQARKSEPYIFGLPEQNPEEIIESKGFSLVKNFPAYKIKNMYFNKMTRARKLHSFWGVIQAIV